MLKFILIWSSFNRNKYWNRKYKTPTFSDIPSHVTILTMLEAIMTSQDNVADEESRIIVAELREIGKFGGFGEERMQALLE